MLIIRQMKLEDCEQVATIEAESFSVPWSLQAFQDTLEMKNYRYFVAEQNGEIVGYCGFIFVLDEAEIPDWETLCGDLTPLCAPAESKGGWERLPRGEMTAGHLSCEKDKIS